ncbi:limostatin isoform X1 [Haematobia irritans]|uniref:limostatin isoform X1 n=1 Tax=Haematobia irritans TaxID=7368 RepID=UPI003F5088BA
MFAVNGKLCIFLAMLMVSLSWAQQFGDSEVPAVLSYNSPLRQPDSLRSRPYFDFLSTLYRHDTEKSSLFQPYISRSRREAVAATPVGNSDRSRRAIVFRPLFVYKQQEIRKQELREDQNSRRV